MNVFPTIVQLVLCRDTHTQMSLYVLKAPYVCAFMCVWMCPGQSTQDYHSLIPHSSPSLDPFKQHFIFLWESLHPSLSVFLFFYPTLSHIHTHHQMAKDGESDREGDAERDDPVFFNLLLIPSRIHLASKLNKNTSIINTHTHTPACRFCSAESSSTTIKKKENLYTM